MNIVPLSCLVSVNSAISAKRNYLDHPLHPLLVRLRSSSIFPLHMASAYLSVGGYHSPPSVTVTSNHDIPRAGSCQEGSC